MFEFTGSLRDDGRPKPFREFLTDFSLAWYVCRGERRSFASVEDCLAGIVDLSRDPGGGSPLYLFLDELPWIAKSSPAFFRSLVTLWNNTLSKNPNIKLFVAGSATSWMMDKIIQARTGLAKRVTAKMHLTAFDLAQARTFLFSKGMEVSHNELLRIFSALGGIPYYLDALDAKLSPLENLHRLLVDANGLLSGDIEYEQLFRYLFESHQSYLQVVNTLVQKKYGMSQEALAQQLEGGSRSSGHLRRILRNLEYSDLIAKRISFLNRQKGAHYFVADEYIRFVSRWLLSRRSDTQVDSVAALGRIFSSHAYTAWQGFDFELIAYKNIHLIVRELGLSGLSVTPHVFYGTAGLQIDLLLARSDKTITICEAKSCDEPYAPTQQDVEKCQARQQALTELLKSKRKPQHFINYCFITRNGLKRNRYFNDINPLEVNLATIL